MKNGDIKNFRLSNQCSAGNGMLLQAMADQFGVPVTEYADVAFEAELAPKFSYGCAVFLDTDRVNFQKEGFSKEELLAGLAQVLPKNVWQYVVQIPRLAALGTQVRPPGRHAVQPRRASRRRSTTSRSAFPDAEVFVHPHTGEAGAIGAAMETLRVVKRTRHVDVHRPRCRRSTSSTRRRTTRRRAATSARTTARARSSTRRRPTAGPSRYISGFSCEKGTVESEGGDARAHRRAQEADEAVPEPGRLRGEAAASRTSTTRRRCPRTARRSRTSRSRRALLGVSARRDRRGRSSARRRGARRSAAAMRIGIPRVLNIYSTGAVLPDLLRGARHPEAERRLLRRDHRGDVGRGRQVRLDRSRATRRRSRRRTSTTCSSTTTPTKKPLKYIFFPMHHARADVRRRTRWTTRRCPIVAGAPEVMKAAFTKEVDFFAERGIEYLDPALTFTEPNAAREAACSRRWGPRLGITEDESDFALPTRRGRRSTIVRRRPAGEGPRDPRDGRGGEPRRDPDARPPVPLGPGPEPRHPRGVPGARLPDPVDALDPEGRASGSTATSRRSSRAGSIETPLEINDVWPENYSANSRAEGVGGEVRGAPPERRRASTCRRSSAATTRRPTASSTRSSQRRATPYSALHDIDANKPGGSIKIRVKTYAHALKLHEERLEDTASKQGRARRYRIDEKRLELLRAQAQQLAERTRQDPALDAQIDELAREGAAPTRPTPTPKSKPEQAAEGPRAARQEDEATATIATPCDAPDRRGEQPTMETTTTQPDQTSRTKLPILGEPNADELDIEAELKKFEDEERKRLGLEPATRALGRRHGRPDVHEKRARAHHAPRRRPDDGARLPHRGRARAASATRSRRSTCPTTTRSSSARSSATAASATRRTSPSATW